GAEALVRRRTPPPQMMLLGFPFQKNHHTSGIALAAQNQATTAACEFRILYRLLVMLDVFAATREINGLESNFVGHAGLLILKCRSVGVIPLLRLPRRRLCRNSKIRGTVENYNHIYLEMNDIIPKFTSLNIQSGTTSCRFQSDG